VTDRSLRNPAVLIATWFGVGLLPRAPGTWGSLAALPFAWVIVGAAGWPALLFATVILFAVGVWAADRTVAGSAVQDPGFIVVDEVAGQWLVLVAAPHNFWAYLLGFLAFRVADIAKPWPASWADRTVKGGFGVMLDDILAALYGVAVMLIYRYAMGN
jgi:phosphatidylglycerophosphatase A